MPSRKLIDAYFDPDIAFSLSRTATFYSYPVKVPLAAVVQAENLRDLMQAVGMAGQGKSYPASAQEVADYVADELDKIMKIQKRTTK